MTRLIAILLGLALLAGAGFAHARGGNGGGRGGGGMGSGGHMGGHPGMSGGHTGGFTRFTTGGFTRMTTGHAGVRPIVGRPPVFVGRPPVFVGRPPFFPHRRVVVGTTVVVGAPFFWYPPYPYPYPYPYAPEYGSTGYAQPPTYVEQGTEVRYYCPDYQDYYPNVASCPSPWMKVLPDTGAYPNPQQQ